MINCKLKELMNKKNINQKELSMLTGIRPNTISGYYNNTFKLVDRNHIDKFCEVFYCNTCDLFEYVKEEEKK